MSERGEGEGGGGHSNRGTGREKDGDSPSPGKQALQRKGLGQYKESTGLGSQDLTKRRRLQSEIYTTSDLLNVKV